MPTPQQPSPGPPRPRIVHRTAQLGPVSRAVYRVDHASSLPGVAMTVTVALIGLVVAGAVLGFPAGWVAGFEVGASAVTLVMVFTIQHTQDREQAATQRKLDELLRALPEAADQLIMLEEAPKEFLREVEENQREVRSGAVGSAPTGRGDP